MDNNQNNFNGGFDPNQMNQNNQQFAPNNMQQGMNGFVQPQDPMMNNGFQPQDPMMNNGFQPQNQMNNGFQPQDPMMNNGFQPQDPMMNNGFQPQNQMNNGFQPQNQMNNGYQPMNGYNQPAPTPSNQKAPKPPKNSGGKSKGPLIAGIIIGVIVLCVAGFFGFAFATLNKGGAKSAKGIVDTYVEATNSDDVEKYLSLLPPKVSNKEDFRELFTADSIIRKESNMKMTNPKVTVEKEYSKSEISKLKSDYGFSGLQGMFLSKANDVMLETDITMDIIGMKTTAHAKIRFKVVKILSKWYYVDSEQVDYTVDSDFTDLPDLPEVDPDDTTEATTMEPATTEKDTTEATTEAATTEKDTTEATTEAPKGDDTPGKVTNSNWRDLEFVYDGKAMTWPITYADMEALGYDLSDYADEELKAHNYTTSVNVKNGAGDSIYLRFKNFSEEDKVAKDCEVLGITVSNKFHQPSFDFALSNGIKFGMTMDKVIEIMGEEPTDSYDSDDRAYATRTYEVNDEIYVSNIEFTFDDGILTEISIENYD